MDARIASMKASTGAVTGASMRRLLWLGLAVASFAVTAGCRGGMDDLDAYIDRVKATPGRRPDPLPEIKPYETFVYRADVEGMRSPFRPDTPVAAPGSAAAGQIRPDSNRSREFLEQFPLDSLDMVGTVTMAGTTYGLIQTQDGLIHRVTPGNYLGQNDGRITDINESEIVLVEIVSDGIGGYLERDAAVSLIE